MTQVPEPHQDRELGERLETERPAARAGFRAALRARLLGSLSARQQAPRRLRILIAACAGSGLLLLAVAAIGVAGAGPLAP